MLKTYFKLAYRNLIRDKAYSIINISGLAIGLASSILILLWVQNELSYDKFHKNAGQIYRIAGDTIYLTCIFMELIVTQFILNPKQDQDTGCQAYCQA